MKKEAFERLLLEKAREIRDLVRAYSPDSGYFDLYIMDLNRVNVSNNYWENDRPIHVINCALDREEVDEQ